MLADSVTVSKEDGCDNVTPNYVPHAIRGLSVFSVLFGEGEGPAEAGAEAKQAVVANGVWRNINCFRNANPVE